MHAKLGSIWKRLFEAVAIDPDLDGVDLRVLFYLLSNLDFENYLRAPQIEISVMLNRHPSHISRSIRKLQEKGIVIAGPKVGRSGTWRLNANFVTKK